MQHDDKRIEGLLVIDKPAGRSSMRVVSDIRRRAGGVKTGHAGTLDPLATGVLVLALGRATRTLDAFMKTRKGYRTVIDLSAFTTTDDDEGERTEIDVSAERIPDEAALRALLEQYTGTIMQRPPAYSAIKVGGKRAYSSARRGEDVVLPPRPVQVQKLTLEHYEWPLVTIDIACGKGFYVRSLARELGERLGTGGTCRTIRRTRVGPFTLDEARTLDELPATLPIDACIPIEQALERLRKDVEGE